jgi:predicted O-methyltransferase YrrM
LLYRLVLRAQPQLITEFGSCFGLSAAHMALALQRVGRDGRLVTVEGSPSRQQVAARTLARAGNLRAESVLGYFEDEFGRLDGADFVFIDGNHQVAPTLRYLEAVVERCAGNCTVVLDDIEDWADDFSAMWTELQADDRFTASGAAASLGVLTIGVPVGLTPEARPAFLRALRR